MSIGKVYFASKRDARAEAYNKLPFGIYKVLKSGKLAAQCSMRCATQEEAEKFAASMNTSNPGKTFVIKV